MSNLIHPTAIIHPEAQLGKEVEIGPYSIIGRHVKIGDKTRIGPHVVIEGHTTLGPENEVFQFASLGAAPQDLKYKNEPSELIIGSRNKIREFVTLHPGTSAGSNSGLMRTLIGDNNLFMANSHVAHDCTVGNNNVFANSTALAGHVSVMNNVILGGMVGVHQFCRIGDYAILGAGAMVGSDVPPYCIGQGDRCHLRGVNIIGLERAKFSEQDIREVKQTYRHLFGTVGKLQEKIASLPQELAARPAIKKLLDFIRDSERGLCTPLRHRSAA